MKGSLVVTVGLVMTGLAAGCSSEALPSWSSCPPGFVGECTTYAMPLDRDDSGKGTVPVFVAHQASSAPSTGHVWLVQGGPGASADAFEGIARQLHWDMPTLDVFTFEQRGVGASGWLGCPQAELVSSEGGTQMTWAEWESCVLGAPKQVGDALRFYTLTAAAEDLALAIDRTRAAGKPVHLYGVSYGTAVVLRYLQLHPEGIDSVILDSVVAPGQGGFSRYDEQYDGVLATLFEACAQDEACKGRFGGDPGAQVRALSQSLTAGACPAVALDKRGFGSVVAAGVRSSYLRQGLLPFFHRLARCESADGAPIRAFVDATAQGGGSSERASDVVYANIAFSELWGDAQPDEIQRSCDAAIACPGSILRYSKIRESYPRYPLDSFAGRWPSTKVPMLLMQGTMDPQTPFALAAAAREHLAGPHFQFVAMPGATHAVVGSARTTDPDALPCGYEVLTKFLAAPSAPVDASCSQRLLPVELAPRGATARALFGTEDAWDNPPVVE